MTGLQRARIAGWGVVLLASWCGCPAQAQVQLEKLTPDDAQFRGYFGEGVAANDVFYAVSSFNDSNEHGQWAGSVYLFDSHSRSQVKKVFPSSAAGHRFFGSSLAMNDTYLVASSTGYGNNAGIVHVFDASSGDELLAIQPADPQSGKVFGRSVAVDGDIIVVGADRDDENGERVGAAYVFDARTGVQLHKLLPGLADGGEYFGSAVALEGRVAVVTAWSSVGSQPGVASVYLFDVHSGQQVGLLSPSDALTAGWTGFGGSIAISDTYIAVGAPSIGYDGLRVGAVYVFDRNSGQEIRIIIPEGGKPGNQFGSSVHFVQDTLVVGATRWNDHRGSVYTFELPSGRQKSHFFADDGDPGDIFGASIGASGRSVIVGAWLDSDEDKHSGSAYVFDLCPWELNGDGAIDAADLGIMIDLIGSSDRVVDFNSDGIVDAADLSRLIAAFGQVCP